LARESLTVLQRIRNFWIRLRIDYLAFRFRVLIYAAYLESLFLPQSVKMRLKAALRVTAETLFYICLMTFIPFAIILVVALLLELYSTGWIAPMKPLFDPELIVSLWVAEVPIAIFLRYLLGEGRQDKPNLVIERKRPTKQVDESGLQDTFAIQVKNTGEVSAEECQATITLKDMMTDNFDDTYEQPTLVSRDNFQSIEDVAIPCPARIRPDGRAPVQFIRAVRESSTHRLLRLEVPSEKGWNPILCALRPRNYRGVVKVGASKGKPTKSPISVLYNRKKDRLRITGSELF
jgi:hypothetical protein